MSHVDASHGRIVSKGGIEAGHSFKGSDLAVDECPDCGERRVTRCTTWMGRLVEEITTACACRDPKPIRHAPPGSRAKEADAIRRTEARISGLCMECAEPVYGSKGAALRCAYCHELVRQMRDYETGSWTVGARARLADLGETELARRDAVRRQAVEGRA
jgi:predicted RNA-binding Zn-ribbon protein involved in translation (DUF1610 family)